MNPKEKLSYEEFFEQMWDYVSSKVVNDRYWFDNQSFIRAVTKDIYDVYIIDEARVQPKYYARIAESFFFNMFDLRPSNEQNPHHRYNDFD